MFPHCGSGSAHVIIFHLTRHPTAKKTTILSSFPPRLRHVVSYDCSRRVWERRPVLKWHHRYLPCTCHALWRSRAAGLGQRSALYHRIIMTIAFRKARGKLTSVTYVPASRQTNNDDDAGLCFFCSSDLPLRSSVDDDHITVT